MWDKTYGGFYTMVDRKGNVIDSTKNAYGNAFGIYALQRIANYQTIPCTQLLHRKHYVAGETQP
jgi:N-acyl-D-glucosamine 2-epimerase